MNNIIKTLGRGWTIVFFAALIAVLSMFVVAGCPPDCPGKVAEPAFDPQTFNPDDPTAFDYVNGDYSTITDWSKVDWDQVVWNKIPVLQIPKVPAEKLQYSQLDFSQRLEMTVEQIKVNLENINNLAKDVEPERAKLAIKQQSGVMVEDFGAAARIEFGSLKTDKVNERFVFAGKEGITIKVDSTGRILVISDSGSPKIREESIHPQDKFTIDDGDFITRDGKRHRVGGLSFNGEQTYVEKGDTFSSWDYSIRANKNQVNIHLGASLSPTGNYVVITEDSVEIHSLPNGEVEVEAEPGNELLLMVPKNYQLGGYNPSSTDTMKMEVSNGDSLRIISRIDEGKTPLIAHHASQGETVIFTGRLAIKLKQGGIAVWPPEPLPLEGKLEPIPNSAAFELESDAAKRSGTMLRTSSSNRYALLRNGKEIAGSDLGLTVSNQAEVNLMKSVEDLQQKYPTIDFDLLNQEEFERQSPEERRIKEIDESMVIEQISAQMAQAVDQWLQGNPLKGSKIKMMIFTGEGNARGGAEKEGGGFVLGERMIDPATASLIQKEKDPQRPFYPLGTFDHEFVHVEDDFVKLKEQDLQDAGKISPLQLSQEGLNQKYNAITLKMFDSLKNDPLFQALIEKAGKFKITLPPPSQAVSEEKSVDILFRKMTVSAIQSSDAFTIMSNLAQAKATSNLIKDEKIRSELQQIIPQLQLVINQQTGGFPLYAFRNYGDQTNPAFHELSSTYTEIPPEKVRREVAKGNPFVRDATQLAYDSGKITEPEYRYRMGGYCRQQACGKCILYTLTCTK